MSETPERATLKDIAVRFTEAFNQDDLDGVMRFLSENVVYKQFNGIRSAGKVAVREAFVPQFRGDFGKMRFLPEDVFVDAETGKALIRWKCTLRDAAWACRLAWPRHPPHPEWPHHREAHLREDESAAASRPPAEYDGCAADRVMSNDASLNVWRP